MKALLALLPICGPVSTLDGSVSQASLLKRVKEASHSPPLLHPAVRTGALDFRSMLAQDLSRSRQPRLIQAHSKCPPPPLTELNHHALDFLDIRDASHLHTLLDSNSSGSSNRYVKRQQQLLETDECATSLPRVIPRGQPRTSRANFKAWTGADLERCQRGRLNCKRRAHFAVGRICVSARHDFYQRAKGGLGSC